ncbi:MAG: hypothetical protein ACLUVC_05075 [Longibaculum sp.]
MEMTMNLPRNYVEIEEEEMMYLDGGGIPISFATNLVYTGITLLGLGAGISAMRKFTAMHGKYLAKKKLKSNLAKVGLGGASLIASAVIDIFITWTDPVGRALNYADGKIDSRKDGWLFGKGWLNWY